MNSSTTTGSSLVELHDLAVDINGLSALTRVDLVVDRGSRVGIVGETGSGKSLTARVLTGLLPRIGARVVGGTATFDGSDIRARAERDWRLLRGRRIALIPQSSMSGLDPLMTVGAQLIESIKFLTDDDDDPHATAAKLLHQVRITDVSKVMAAHPHELSGGMRQRVMIALALIGTPDLIIADESTTALDVTVQRAILDILSAITKDTTASLIVISHDLDVVQAVTETLVIMYAGMTVEYGPTREVLRNPAHPYTRALLGARPGRVDRGQSLVAIPGVALGLGERPIGCPFAPRCEYVEPRCTEALPPATELSAGHATACVVFGSGVSA